jgi:hypothetical protein
MLALIGGLFALTCCLEIDGSYRARAPSAHDRERQRCPILAHASLDKLEVVERICRSTKRPQLDEGVAAQLREMIELRAKRTTWRGDVVIACLAALATGLAIPLGSTAQTVLVFFVTLAIVSRRHGWDYVHGGLQNLDADMNSAISMLEGKKDDLASGTMLAGHCWDKRAEPWRI